MREFKSWPCLALLGEYLLGDVYYGEILGFLLREGVANKTKAVWHEPIITRYAAREGKSFLQPSTTFFQDHMPLALPGVQQMPTSQPSQGTGPLLENELHPALCPSFSLSQLPNLYLVSHEDGIVPSPNLFFLNYLKKEPTKMMWWVVFTP